MWYTVGNHILVKIFPFTDHQGQVLSTRLFITASYNKQTSFSWAECSEGHQVYEMRSLPSRTVSLRRQGSSRAGTKPGLAHLKASALSSPPSESVKCYHVVSMFLRE